MRKIIAFVLLTAVMSMMGAASANERLTGGWTPSGNPAVTEEMSEIFAKGTETLTGIVLRPLIYLGSQVVAGRNHAFLCQTETGYPGSVETEPAYLIVYLYEDLRGNVAILNIANLDIGALCIYGAV